MLLLGNAPLFILGWRYLGGPRLCIGNAFAQAEAVLVLATFVQNFDLDLLPGHKVVMDALVTLRPRGGLAMRVRRVD